MDSRKHDKKDDVIYNSISLQLKELIRDDTGSRLLMTSFKQCNFNEIRLKYAYLNTVNKVGNNTSLQKTNICKTFHNGDHVIWMYLSSNVATKKYIGFPLVYDVCTTPDNSAIIEFETYPSMAFTPAIEKIFYNNNSVLFQKLFIGLNLYYAGISATILKFNVYNVSACKISFRIGDLFFSFDIDKLVILSPDTNLKFFNSMQSIILNNILLDYGFDTNYVNESNDSIITYIINEFTNHIDDQCIPGTSEYILHEIPIQYFSTCKLVWVKHENTNKLGYIIDWYQNIATILFLCNQRIPKKPITFQTCPVDIGAVFDINNIHIIPRLYTIGKSNIITR